tara:strand:- start:1013 stop:1639 length:627 start_codon:yes stop_codon:yes gene_type:complete
MHKINVISFGSKNFNISLEELKDHLNFKLTTIDTTIDSKTFDSYDVLFCHQDFFNKNSSIDIFKKSNRIKILAYSSEKVKFELFDDKIFLPVKFEEINNIIENSIAKKNFSKNSSIKIKKYILDKNEKKLLKDKSYVLLTEKEIQLLELLLSYNKPISKDKILDEVWKYSEDTDTHTVETHIYRLRKKIKIKFLDDDFILNDKSGYLL